DAGLGAMCDRCLGITVDPPAFHGSMIRKKPAPEVIRGGNRFSENIVLHQARTAGPSTAGEAARPPAAAPRPLSAFAVAVAGLSDNRLRGGRRGLRGSRRRNIAPGCNRRPFAHGRAPTR